MSVMRGGGVPAGLWQDPELGTATAPRWRPMLPVADDDGWKARMAERAREAVAMTQDAERPIFPPRESWPVPAELRGYSARDCFLWYICDGWRRIFGDDPPIETVFDHDFGHHVLRKGAWQLELTDLDQFPGEDWTHDPYDVVSGAPAVEPGTATTPRRSYAIELTSPVGEHVEWQWDDPDELDFDEIISVANASNTVRVRLWLDAEDVLRLRIGIWEEGTDHE